MKNTKGKFTGVGGLELFYQAWLPERKPRAIVVIVHGVLEHCGRYMNLVNTLVPKGFGFFGFDLRGHGRSQGQRGHINHFSEYREDLRTFVELVHKRQPGVPVFLYGHSLGAMIIADLIEHFQDGIVGAVLSAGSFKLTGTTSPLLVLMAKVMSRLLPIFSMDLQLDVSALSRDPVDRAKRASDPLIKKMVSARWGTEYLCTINEVWENVGKIQIPLLIVHGEDDKIGYAEGAREFFNKIKFKDKTLKIYPGAYHEVHNDFGWQTLTKDLETWLKNIVRFIPERYPMTAQHLGSHLHI